jgi:DNA ligase-associated metallophosphoesterase
MCAMRSRIEIVFAGQRLLLDSAGAIFWPAANALLVSDLHFEKASFLSQFGSPLPRYDTRATLARLHALIAHYQPEQVICLGDSFHDRKAFSRLEPADRDMLFQLIASVTHWRWIMGNHDPAMDAALPGTPHAALDMQGIMLTHEPQENPAPRIIGHFHPKLHIRLGGHRVHGPLFAHDHKLLIMPSFGSFTGGLDVRDNAIARLLTQPDYYLLYREKIWKV